MVNLKETLGADDKRPALIDDCISLVDAQVKAKSGMGGLAIRGAYKTVKAIKRNFVHNVVDALLDGWLVEIQPHYDEWQVAGAKQGFGEFLGSRGEAVAEDLLKVTDAQAKEAKSKTAVKLYKKFRPTAVRDVASAAPELGDILQKHLEAQPEAQENAN